MYKSCIGTSPDYYGTRVVRLRQTMSKTSCSGNPNLANLSRSFVMVLLEVVVDIVNTSGHFECASTITSNVLPLTGPA